MNMEPGVHLKLNSSSQSAVDAYLEYKRIVGDDDNGVLFSPEEYEEYKKTVLPKRLKNRVYVSWTNGSGLDCKLVGPETKCFCQHRYREHKTDVDIKTTARPFKLPCKKCNCSSYNYVPLNGSEPLRCHCKHFADDHSPTASHACSKPACNCRAFRTSFACGCGEVVASHETLIETKDERLERGHPVAKNEPVYAAMGGITGFSSLLDGYLRLDESGIGAPPKEVLEQPTTSTDHPFLRAFNPRGNPAIAEKRDGKAKQASSSALGRASAAPTSSRSHRSRNNNNP